MNFRSCLLAPALIAVIFSNSEPGFAADYDGSCMNAPPLAAPDNVTVVRVTSEAALQQAINSVSSNSVVELAPGEYRLTSTLWINDRNNVTIRGDSDRCDEVVLIGKGMENSAGVNSVPHGIWTNGANIRVENLTIRDVYYHAINIDGSAEAPRIYNVRMLDIGEQFIKSNPQSFANGADNGRVEYSVMKYLSGPPQTDHGGGTGYTNGVDVHGGSNWLISNSRFENFHTPDNSQNLWNPAILMWNGASDTRVENNTFLDVDRAIAFGLLDRSNDHSGGIIVNNMVTLRSGLFSASRKQGSDAVILLWSSPGTKVLHNTLITQGNTNKSIELRFDSNSAVVQNNLVSAPISDRSGNTYVDSGNVQTNETSIFVNPSVGDLHLKSLVSGITSSAALLDEVPFDIDGNARSVGQKSDVGADELPVSSGFCM